MRDSGVGTQGGSSPTGDPTPLSRSQRAAPGSDRAASGLGSDAHCALWNRHAAANSAGVPRSAGWSSRHARSRSILRTPATPPARRPTPQTRPRPHPAPRARIPGPAPRWALTPLRSDGGRACRGRDAGGAPVGLRHHCPPRVPANDSRAAILHAPIALSAE